MKMKKGFVAALAGVSLFTYSAIGFAADGINDTEATAKVLNEIMAANGTAIVKATIADLTDLDWYTYRNYNRLPLLVTVTLNSPATKNYDFNYWIYKYDGTVQRGLRSAAGVGGTETLSFTLYAGESVSVRVGGYSYAYDSVNPYTLTLKTVSPY